LVERRLNFAAEPGKPGAELVLIVAGDDEQAADEGDHRNGRRAERKPSPALAVGCKEKRQKSGAGNEETQGL
jgi:hypothetical protein